MLFEYLLEHESMSWQGRPAPQELLRVILSGLLLHSAGKASIHARNYYYSTEKIRSPSFGGAHAFTHPHPLP